MSVSKAVSQVRISPEQVAKTQAGMRLLEKEILKIRATALTLIGSGGLLLYMSAPNSAERQKNDETAQPCPKRYEWLLSRKSIFFALGLFFLIRGLNDLYRGFQLYKRYHVMLPKVQAMIANQA